MSNNNICAYILASLFYLPNFEINKRNALTVNSEQLNRKKIKICFSDTFCRRKAFILRKELLKTIFIGKLSGPFRDNSKSRCLMKNLIPLVWGGGEGGKTLI